jgi:hypothetical protein
MSSTTTVYRRSARMRHRPLPRRVRSSSGSISRWTSAGYRIETPSKTSISFKQSVAFERPSKAFTAGDGFTQFYSLVRTHNEMVGRRLHPFSVPLEDFLEMSPSQARRLHMRVGTMFKKLLDSYWARGMKQVVLCEGEVVLATESEEILSDRVRQIATEHGKPCYSFSAPDVAEESSWVPVGGDDYYPSIDIFLGAIDAGDEETNRFVTVKADFDTGNKKTKLFDAEQVGYLLGNYTNLDWFEGTGPFGVYRYVPKHAKLAVLNESGARHSTSDVVYLVENWNGSTVRKFSPNRRGFVGRDLLRGFVVKVELDPMSRTTRVHAASA